MADVESSGGLTRWFPPKRRQRPNRRQCCDIPGRTGLAGAPRALAARDFIRCRAGAGRIRRNPCHTALIRRGDEETRQNRAHRHCRPGAMCLGASGGNYLIMAFGARWVARSGADDEHDDFKWLAPDALGDLNVTGGLPRSSSGRRLIRRRRNCAPRLASCAWKGHTERNLGTRCQALLTMFAADFGRRAILAPPHGPPGCRRRRRRAICNRLAEILDPALYRGICGHQ